MWSKHSRVHCLVGIAFFPLLHSVLLVSRKRDRDRTGETEAERVGVCTMGRNVSTKDSQEMAKKILHISLGNECWSGIYKPLTFLCYRFVLCISNSTFEESISIFEESMKLGCTPDYISLFLGDYPHCLFFLSQDWLRA